MAPLLGLEVGLGVGLGARDRVSSGARIRFGAGDVIGLGLNDGVGGGIGRGVGVEFEVGDGGMAVSGTESSSSLVTVSAPVQYWCWWLASVGIGLAVRFGI